MIPAIRVKDLGKTYRVPVRDAGIRAALFSLLKRETRTIDAVRDISLSINQGEIVGFLGPNGAGKTTTIKMLTGLLHPSSGSINVCGFVPYRRQHDFLRQITLVMGQRNQLLWDIPVIDSFERNRAIYQLRRTEFRKNMDELTELLNLGELLNRPVRNLSLGERMKCEVAVALLHRPTMLFLDEPTIGLDVTMQRQLREFIREYNRTTGATVLLTSHYMADVEALCSRIIVIDLGIILFDGRLADLVQKYTAHKTIRIELENEHTDLSGYPELISNSDGKASFSVVNKLAPDLTNRLLSEVRIIDLTVEDPPIEDTIEMVFNQRG